MGFTAPGTATAQPAIDSGSFWPVLEPDLIRQQMRLDGSISNARLRHALILAAATVNDDLAAWATRHRARGMAHLDDIETTHIDGQSRLSLLYRRAVACLAAAELTEHYRSFDATHSGHQRADLQTPTIDELRRDARWALRDLKGRTRTTVELI